jgi:hypothetical protein
MHNSPLSLNNHRDDDYIAELFVHYISVVEILYAALLCYTPLSHSSHHVLVDSMTVIPSAVDKTTTESDEKPYEVVRMYIKAREFYEKVMNDRKVKDKKNKRAEQTMLPGSKLTQNIAVTVLLGAITVGNVPQRKSSVEKIDKKVFLINISPIDGMRFDCNVPSDPTFLPFKMNSEKIRDRIQKDKEKEREKEIEREGEKEREREKEKQEKQRVNVEVNIKGKAPEENKGSLNLRRESSDLRMVKEGAWEETIKYDYEVGDKKGGAELEEDSGREEEEEVEGGKGKGKGKGRGEERQWEQKQRDNQNNQHSSNSVTAAAAVAVIGFAAPGGTHTVLERERECVLDNAAEIIDYEGGEVEGGESELMDSEEIIDSAIKKDQEKVEEKEKEEKEKEERAREGHSVRCLDADLGPCIPTHPSSPPRSSSPRKNM